MDKNYKQLLHLLRIQLVNEEADINILSAINGTELFRLSLAQGISAIIFSTVHKYKEFMKIEDDVITRWRESTIVVASRQLMMIPTIRKIIELLDANDIPAISLKGLVFKQLYQQPELRHMSDLDLIIHEKDMQKSVDLLVSNGYTPNSVNYNDPQYMHIDMNKPGTFSIELHRTLWHPKYMQLVDTNEWLDHIWKNKRRTSLSGLEFYSLSPEDELINAVIHTARHLKHSNASLRLLCDFSLYFNNYSSQMDFDYIERTIKSMTLFTFYQHLIGVCHLYLGLNLPNTYKSIINMSKAEKIMGEILKIDKLNSTQNLQSNPPNKLTQLKLFVCNLRLISIILKKIQPIRSKAWFLRGIGLHFRY